MDASSLQGNDEDTVSDISSENSKPGNYTPIANRQRIIGKFIKITKTGVPYNQRPTCESEKELSKNFNSEETSAMDVQVNCSDEDEEDDLSCALDKPFAKGNIPETMEGNNLLASAEEGVEHFKKLSITNDALSAEAEMSAQKDLHGANGLLSEDDGATCLAIDGSNHLSADAEELLDEGRSKLNNGNFKAAINILRVACFKFAEKFGKFSELCVDAYYDYGCALLISIHESNPVEGEGNVIGGPYSTDLDSITLNYNNIFEDAKLNGVRCLELALHVFMLIKSIIGENNNELLVKIYLKLSEVMLLTNNVESAIKYIKECLIAQEKVFADNLLKLDTVCLSREYYQIINEFTKVAVKVSKLKP